MLQFTGIYYIFKVLYIISLYGLQFLSIIKNHTRPGIYYAKVFLKNPGDTSTYEISNQFKKDPSGIQITIQSPENNDKITDDAIILKAKIKSHEKIANIDVLLDDKQLLITDYSQKDNHVWAFSHRITSLRLGANILTITALDELGNYKIEKIEFIRY